MPIFFRFNIGHDNILCIQIIRSTSDNSVIHSIQIIKHQETPLEVELLYDISVYRVLYGEVNFIYAIPFMSMFFYLFL